MLPDRISAVIIKDRKILLVSDDSNIFWTPGGKVERAETHQETLDRELCEELQIRLLSLRQYFSYVIFHPLKKDNQQVYCYLVEYDGDIFPSHEIIRYGWFSKNDLPPLLDSVKNVLIPRLIEDGLL